MGSQIQISSPFLRKFIHADVSVGTTKQVLLAAPTNISEKRIAIIVQNTSSTAGNNIQVWGSNEAGDTSNGIFIAPLSTLVFDNYNGGLWCKANTAGTSVHIAYASV
jgi:hypothetical protein